MTAAPTLMDVTQSERMPGSRHPFAVLREAVALRLRSPGARRWYFGSLWGLAYVSIPIILTWVSGANPVSATLLTIHVVVLGVVYVVLPPLLWGRPWQIAAVAYTAFLAYTCLAIPLIGVNTVWLWLYVPIMAAMSWLPVTFTV